ALDHPLVEQMSGSIMCPSSGRAWLRTPRRRSALEAIRAVAHVCLWQILLQNSCNAVRSISHKQTKRAVIADRCSPQAITEGAREFVARQCSPSKYCSIAACTARKICIQSCKKTFATKSALNRRRCFANVRFAPCVDGSGLAREIFTSQAWSVQPCVRPVNAV